MAEKPIVDRLKTRQIRKAVTPYLLLLPATFLIGLFVYGVLNGVLQGFGIMPFLGQTDFTLSNYMEALGRPDFLAATGYSLYLALVSSVLALLGGTILSAALTRIKAGRTFQLFSIQVPLVTAHMLVVLFVVSLFAGSGLVPRLLYAFGIGEGIGSFPSVIGSPSGWGIMLVYGWKEIAFVAFFTLAIMSHVSDRYQEAAATLGASHWRSFFTITLPLCRGALIKAFLIVFAFAFGSYEVPYLLGPTLPKTLPVLAYMEFQNPDLLNRDYAMAINGIMTGICCLVSVVYFMILQRERKL